MQHQFNLHGSKVVIADKLTAFRQILNDLYRSLWPEAKQARPSRLTILTDSNTTKYCLPELLHTLQEPDPLLLEMPAGETAKNLASCQHIWTDMLAAGLDRHALMIVLGGGVPGDLGGFCASTYMRGIPFVFLPTTLLAQTDASIGGKLGIDFNGLKNAIGLFRQPELVFIWPGFLKSLPDRQLLSGWAEVVKHALIADAGLWQTIRKIKTPQPQSANTWLIPSITVKKKIVEKDPEEKGLRKLLNFGHTIGHALESLFLHSDEELLHGEAVALGMQYEARLAHQLGLLPREQLSEITAYLSPLYPRPRIHPQDKEKLAYYLLRDKKNRAGKIRFSLIGPIGRGHIHREVPPEQVLRLIFAG